MRWDSRQSGAKQVGSLGRSTLHGGQSQFAEQGVAGVRIGAGPRQRQHREPCEWIPAEHLGVNCLDQGIAQA